MRLLQFFYKTVINFWFLVTKDICFFYKKGKVQILSYTWKHILSGYYKFGGERVDRDDNRA